MPGHCGTRPTDYSRAVDAAQDRFDRALADARQLLADYVSDAAVVAGQIEAATPDLFVRLPGMAGNPLYAAGPLEQFVGSINDAFFSRALLHIAAQDAVAAHVVAALLPESVAVMIVPLENGLAASVADGASVAGRITGFLTIVTATATVIVAVVATGGAAAPAVGALASTTTILGGASTAMGLTEAVAGVAAGQPEHVAAGGVSAAMGILPIPYPGQVAVGELGGASVVAATNAGVANAAGMPSSVVGGAVAETPVQKPYEGVGGCHTARGGTGS